MYGEYDAYFIKVLVAKAWLGANFYLRLVSELEKVLQRVGGAKFLESAECAVLSYLSLTQVSLGGK